MISTIVRHITQYKVPVDESTMFLISDMIPEDDIMKAIAIFDRYSVPVPTPLVMRIPSTISMVDILDSFSRDTASSMVSVYASRMDTPITESCLRYVRDCDDEYLLYVCLSAYMAKHGSIPDIAIDDTIVPMPLVDPSEYRERMESSITSYHRSLYRAIISRINIFNMGPYEASDVAMNTLMKHASTIGTVEATILSLIIPREEYPSILEAMGPRTPKLVVGHINSQMLVIEANLPPDTLRHYIMNNDIDHQMIDHILGRCLDGEIQMESVYYYALNKVTDTSEALYLYANRHMPNIERRLAAIIKMDGLPRSKVEGHTLLMDPFTNVPEPMVIKVGMHSFSASDIYGIMGDDLCPYTRIPFTDKDKEEMESFIRELMKEGYPVMERPIRDDDHYCRSSISAKMMEDYHLNPYTTIVVCSMYLVMVSDLVDVANIMRSEYASMEDMVRDMYPDAYQWLCRNTMP